MGKNYIFSSESVGEGHPDKVSDTISDAVLDACLAQDRRSRVACETFVKSNVVCLGGEITTKAKFDIDQVVRDAIREIGYVNDDDVFHADSVFINNYLTAQSPDISQGVDAKAASGKATAEQGAGDQGLMFGFACDETDVLMPLPIHLAHRMAERHAEVRKAGTIPYLRPDAKTQVTFEYEGNRPVRLRKVLISAQHNDGIDRDSMIRPDLIEQVIRPVVPARFADDDYEVIVNPTGRFVIGGPAGDTGLTGRKIIVDTYGGYARHGGGAFSGKDPTKVDRSAAYAARYVAKNLVASGIADRAEVLVSYAIGMSTPISVSVETFDTNRIDSDKIHELVNKHFDLRPAAIIQDLDLRRPIYKPVAAYGHFGRDDLDLTWERTDKAELLRSEAGL